MTRFLFALIALAHLFPARAEPLADSAGHWEGQISLASTHLDIRVDLERTGEVWSGTIDIPGQGLRGFKLEPVKVDGAAVNFAMPKIPGDPAFAGKFDKDADTISGDFTQAAIKASFKLERRARPAPDAGDMPAKGLPGEGLAGHWFGSLHSSRILDLRLALEIEKTSAGALEGVLISLDQSRVGIPLTAITEKVGAVAFAVGSIGGVFEGKINAEGSEVAGEWQQGGIKSPVTFKRVAQAPALARPQEPRKPYPYGEEEVQVKNEPAGITLAGTLTLPPGDGPHPAVVLITGSGPQNRDEALMGHRPFLVLADRLTRAGIAVLRCDDRGFAQSTGDFGQAVTDDFADDALAAVAWLRTRPRIDARRIGLLGHSEGGIVAPMAVVKKPNEIAFIVLLAGVGVPVEETLIRQGVDLQRALGTSEESINKLAAMQRKIFSRLKQTTDSADAEKIAREMIVGALAEYTPEQREAMGWSETMVAGQSKMAASPWFRKLLTYDPRPALRQVKCPVLAINGEKDLQVAAKENLAAIREALAAGHNERVKIVEFPSLNHLFQTCTTGAMSEYGQIEETIAPVVLDLVAEWIREQPQR